MNSSRKIARTYLLFFLTCSILYCGDNKSDAYSQPLEKKICYIDSVFTKEGKRFAKVDFIEWFQGEQAVKAFQRDNPNKNTTPPEGCYIRNKKVKHETFAVADTTKITMQTFSYGSDGNFRFNEKISFNSFIDLFSQKKYERYRHIPFWIAISSKQIISIEEQYIP